MRQRVINLWTLAGVIALAGGLTGTALGQTFSFGEPIGDAAPGQMVTVPVFVTGGPADTAALNFTVSVNNNADANIGGSQYITGDITGSKASNAAITAYQYQDNSIARTDGKEYRAVLYAPSSSTAAFSTADKTHVANVSFTIASDAPEGAKINLWFDRAGQSQTTVGFDEDGITALVGISNAAGQSIVPSGTPATARPNREAKAIAVTGPSGYEFQFDGEQDVADMWQFSKPIPPGFDRFTALNQNPYLIDITGNFAFGTLSSVNTEATRFKPSGANVVVNYGFMVGSDQASDALFPQIRVRANAGDKTVANLADYAALNNPNAERTFIPEPGTPVMMDNYMFVYPENADGTGETGFAAAMDVNTILAGDFTSTNVTVHSFSWSETPVSALANEQTILTHDFRNQMMPNGVTYVAEQFANATTSHTNDGLVADPNGASDFDNFDFNFDDGVPGWVFNRAQWKADLTDWVSDSTKLYSVEFTLTSAASAPLNMNVTRLSLRPVNQTDFVSETQISSNSTAHPEFYPTAGSSRTYRTFFSAPSDFDGRAMALIFEVWNDNPTDNGAVILQDVTVKSYDKP